MEQDYYVNVHDIVGNDVEIDYTSYYDSEQNKLTPAIEKAGYQVIGGWSTSEGDSFGPLSRSLRAINPEGRQVKIFYG